MIFQGQPTATLRAWRSKTRRSATLAIALALMASLLAAIAPDILRAGAVDPFQCWAQDNGTDFDITWTDVEAAEKYVVYRQVDDSGTWNWRAAVDQPALEFLADPEPNQSHTTVDYEVRAKVGSSIIDTATCAEGAAPPTDSLTCDFLEVNVDDYTITINPNPDNEGLYHRIYRSIDGAPRVLLTAIRVGDFYYFDEDVPTGVLTYETESVATGGAVLETVDCTVYDYTPPDVESFGIPLLPDGTVGVVGSNVLPVPVTVPDRPAAATDPGSAGSACTAQMRTSFPNPVDRWVKITIPAGMTMRGDVLNRKGGTQNGNWSGGYKFYEVNADGNLGNQVLGGGGINIVTDYSWDSSEQDDLDHKLFKNKGATREFFMTFETYVVVGVDTSEGAYTELTNVRFVDDNGDLTAKPCLADDVQYCEDAGGDLVLDQPVTHVGVEYSGCNDYQEPCLPAMSALGGLIGQFKCAGGAGSFLNSMTTDLGWGALGWTMIIVGVMVVVVATPLVVGAGVLSAPFLAAVAGGVLILGGLAILTLVVNDEEVEVLVDTFSDIEITDNIQDLMDRVEERVRENPPRIFPELPKPKIEGDDLVELLFRAALEEIRLPAPPDDLPLTDEEWEEAIKRNAKRALLECTEVVNEETFEDLVPDWGDELVKDDEHACNGISIIVPGGFTNPKDGINKPIWQATQHIGEAVYGTESFSPELPMHDEAPGVVNGQPGTLSWLLLKRWQARGPILPDTPWFGWYSLPPYDCNAKNETVLKENECDEYPWAATSQGGPTNRSGEPQSPFPHLRIINGSHNRDSGNELGAFYNVCHVDDEEWFMSIPTPLALIPLIPGAGPLEDLPMHHLIPTIFLGESCS